MSGFHDIEPDVCNYCGGQHTTDGCYRAPTVADKPAAERCVKCGHKKSCFKSGFCHYSEPSQHGVFCGCECKFTTPAAPPTGEDYREGAGQLVNAVTLGTYNKAANQLVVDGFALRDAIAAFTESQVKAARTDALEDVAGIAEAMAHGEDVSTGRLKAVNIAAAIRALIKQPAEGVGG